MHDFRGFLEGRRGQNCKACRSGLFRFPASLNPKPQGFRALRLLGLRPLRVLFLRTLRACLPTVRSSLQRSSLL